MTTTLYIKAASEAAMLAALDAAGLVIDGQVQVVGRADVYLIGTMYDTTNPEAPVAIDGYHANVRTDDAEVLAALAPLAVAVATPAFVFA